MIKLVIDCFGGDNSPKANIEGSIIALNKFDDLELILSGDSEIINKELLKYTYDKNRVTILHAPLVLTGNDKPTDAVRLKKDSSMIQGIRYLRENDDVDGIVSSGPTGCLVTAAMVRLGRVEGVIRPAFCPIFKTVEGEIVAICDSGANIDVKADMLQQYGIMGSIYLQTVYGINNPRVALLNVGVEEEKGDDVHKEAYQLLKNTKGINFVGNMEGRDLLSGKYDLVVCDGFSGNVLLKTTEGTALELLKKVKKEIMSKAKYKFGALFLKSMFKDMKELMNYQNYGGSVLLGSEKTIVKGHGSLDGEGFSNCVEQAYKIANLKIVDKFKKEIAEAINKGE